MGGTCDRYGGDIWAGVVTHDYAVSEMNGVRIAIPGWGSS